MSGRLLFTWKDGLAALNLETSRLDQLAPAPSGARVSSARWSPSGTQVAYGVSPQEIGTVTRSAVYVAAADGSDARTLVSAESSTVFYQWPVWDPTGPGMFFMRAEASGQRIERIDLASGQRTTVLDRAADFDVSPDGSVIVFVRNADAGGSLNLARLGGGEPRVLVGAQPLQVVAAPRFSPDGRTVLFSLSRAPAPDAASLELRLADVLHPATAFAHGFPQDIYTIPVEGGQPRMAVRIGADDPTATWSPEGARLGVLTPDALGLATPGAAFTPILAPGGYGTVDWAQ
jgi:Tol biopolymer transport system component